MLLKLFIILTRKLFFRSQLCIRLNQALFLKKDIYKISKKQMTHTLSHLDKQKKMFHIFYSNITEWGPQAQSCLFSARSKAEHIHMLVEHHQFTSSLIQDAYAKAGMSTFLTPAQKTGRSEKGTLGGECVAIKRHIACRGISEDLKASILRAQIFPRVSQILPSPSPN